MWIIIIINLLKQKMCMYKTEKNIGQSNWWCINKRSLVWTGFIYAAVWMSLTLSERSPDISLSLARHLCMWSLENPLMISFLQISTKWVSFTVPLSTFTSELEFVLIRGKSFAERLINCQVVAELQSKFLERSYPSANHIRIRGADRHMIYKNPSSLIKHLHKLVSLRQSNQQRQWDASENAASLITADQ